MTRPFPDILPTRVRNDKSGLSYGLSHIYRGPAKLWSPGLMNFVSAVAYLFCLNLPAAFSQPGDQNFAGPCSRTHSFTVASAAIGPQPWCFVPRHNTFPIASRASFLPPPAAARSMRMSATLSEHYRVFWLWIYGTAERHRRGEGLVEGRGGAG